MQDNIFGELITNSNCGSKPPLEMPLLRKPKIMVMSERVVCWFPRWLLQNQKVYQPCTLVNVLARMDVPVGLLASSVASTANVKEGNVVKTQSLNETVQEEVVSMVVELVSLPYSILPSPIPLE